jgi:HEAT repeat protein
LLGLEPFANLQNHPDILPALLNALRDRDTQVRMTAVDIVSRIKDPRARAAMRFRYKYEQRRDVRRVLELAMKRLDE